jgi:uncharacterized protein (TIGR02271 family)
MSDHASGYGSSQSGTEGNRTVSAFFDTRADAERATSRLRGKGIADSSIHLTEGAPTQHTDATRTDATRTDAYEEKGFFESIGDFFFPEEDRHTYAEGLSRGGFLLTVRGLPAGMYDMALDILDDEGAVDVDERAASWRSEGWAGYQGSGYTAENAGRNVGGDETVPVVEERLRVGKRDTSHGRVRVRSYVHETPVSEEVELRDEHIEVERRPVDRPAKAGEDAFRDRSIEAEEHAEEAVVSKEARVTEEVALHKDAGRRTETVSDTVRHTDVEIEDDRKASDAGKSKRR